MTCQSCNGSGFMDIYEGLESPPCPSCDGNGKIERPWVTKTGQKIPIPQLGTEHLGNILRMLKKNAMIQQSAVEVSYLIMKPDDDLADRVLEEMENVHWRNYVHPIFEDLEAEAKKRSLVWCDEKEDLLWQTKLTLAGAGYGLS